MPAPARCGRPAQHQLVKAFRTITEALRRSPVERGAIAVADRLDAFIPRVVRTPWGELELDPQHRWRLIHVACKAKDVSEFEREKEVTGRLLAVAAQVPGAIGAGASVLDLADDLAKAESAGDFADKAGTMLLCTTAEAAANRAR
jgi:hypothetical protein